MNIYPSENNQECSSGCESGWTLYLEHDSSISSPYASWNRENDYRDGRRNRVFTQVKRLKRGEEEEEEELEEEEDKDLSMVSDASSGPPHFHELEHGYNNGNDQTGCFYHYSSTLDANSLSRNNYLVRQKTKENQRRRKVNEDQSSLLDDTASSPFLDFSSKSFGYTSSSCQPSMENHVLEYSQGYSTTQFEARPPCQEQYDFFQYSSMSGNQLHKNQWLI